MAPKARGPDSSGANGARFGMVSPWVVGAGKKATGTVFARNDCAKSAPVPFFPPSGRPLPYQALLVYLYLVEAAAPGLQERCQRSSDLLGSLGVPCYYLHETAAAGAY